MQVDSDNCTMPFLTVPRGYLNTFIREYCLKLSKYSSFFVLCTFIVKALQVYYWQKLNMLHIKIFHIDSSIYWYKVYTNSMICSAVRDKNFTPKFAKPRIFGDFK
jgi:hypothetical protein